MVNIVRSITSFLINNPVIITNLTVSNQLTIDSLSGILKASAGIVSGSSTTTDLPEGTNLYFTNARFDTRFALKTTTDLTEGTNLYYTQARFDTAFGLKSTTDLTEGTNLYYTLARFNSAFSSKSTTDLAEGTNLYYTQARFDTAFGLKTTTNLAEGTNLYFTDERAQDAIGSILTDSSTIDFTYSDAGNTITASVIQSGITHNNLSGLTTGDPHTQYALLAGRSGGQTLIGGTASGNSIVLQSTSHATKGFVDLDSFTRLYPSFSSSSGDLFEFKNTFNHGTGSINYFEISPTVTINNVASITRIFRCAGTWTQSGSSLFNIFNMFYSAATLQTSDTNAPPIPLVFYNQTAYGIRHNVGTLSGVAPTGFIDQGSITATTSSANGTIGGIYSFQSNPVISVTNASAVLTVTNRIGLRLADVSFTATGSLTLTNNIGINIADFVVGTSGNRTVTNVYGLKSELTSGTNRFFIYADSAQSIHSGNFQIGSTSGTPETTLHLKGSTACITLEESSATPSNPASGSQGRIYIKDNKIIFQWNDGGTVRYKYLDLTGTGVTLVHTTTAP